MKLQMLVFERAKAEVEAWEMMKESGDYSRRELAMQRERFVAIYQIIEEAGLEADYEAWRQNNS